MSTAAKFRTISRNLRAFLGNDNVPHSTVAQLTALAKLADEWAMEDAYEADESSRKAEIVAVAERCDQAEASRERLRRAVRDGGDLEGAMLSDRDDGELIGQRLLAFSAAYANCEEHGDLEPAAAGTVDDAG